MQVFWLDRLVSRLMAFLAVLSASIIFSACSYSNHGGAQYSSGAPIPPPQEQSMGSSPYMRSGENGQASSEKPAPEKTEHLYTSAPSVLEPTSSSTTNRIYTEAQNHSQTGETPLLNQTEPVEQGASSGAQDSGISEADKSLARKIRLALMHDPAFSTLEPGVKLSVDNGKVTLQGAVGQQSDKSSLRDFIQGVSGVKSVDDQLEVKASAQ